VSKVSRIQKQILTQRRSGRNGRREIFSCASLSFAPLRRCVRNSRSMIRPILILALTVCAFTSSQTVHSTATTVVAQKPASFDVRKFGAKGDGKALDSPAINKAIDAAAAAGGGTVLFTAGTYRSFSIRLKSNVALHRSRRDHPRCRSTRWRRQIRSA
jgi:Pectate lyase superfamily protein